MWVPLQFCNCLNHAILYAQSRMRPTCKRSGGCVFSYRQDCPLLSSLISLTCGIHASGLSSTFRRSSPRGRRCLLRACRHRPEIPSPLAPRRRGVLHLPHRQARPSACCRLVITPLILQVARSPLLGSNKLPWESRTRVLFAQSCRSAPTGHCRRRSQQRHSSSRSRRGRFAGSGGRFAAGNA
jgi:hypothetical protein